MCGLTTVVKEVKGSAPGWLEANEMCVWGCQSLVAILRAKGRFSSLLIVVTVSRPPVTAREPFYGRCQ